MARRLSKLRLWAQISPRMPTPDLRPRLTVTIGFVLTTQEVIRPIRISRVPRQRQLQLQRLPLAQRQLLTRHRLRHHNRAPLVLAQFHGKFDFQGTGSNPALATKSRSAWFAIFRISSVVHLWRSGRKPQFSLARPAGRIPASLNVGIQKECGPAIRLGWYAQYFEMVEVNSTFYSVPDIRMVERWCATTPDAFTFDIKLHQLFSFHSTPVKLLPPDLQRRAAL
jgi:Protein of unknown function DUF72